MNELVFDELRQNGFRLENGSLSHADAPCLLDEVIGPEGVVAIDNYCFADSPNLKRVNLPSSIREIGVGAFSGCKLLENVELPSGISRLRKDVFAGCERLETVAIPDGVTSIGEWAFRGCIGLKSVAIPASVTEICAESFLACPNLVLDTPQGSYAEEHARAMQRVPSGG